jgi:hypothetical protein
MKQEVSHSSGGWTCRQALRGSAEITLLIYTVSVDSCLVLHFSILLHSPKWMDSLSGALGWMASYCQMLLS